MIRQQL